MRKQNLYMELANLVCKFGEDKVLLDLFHEIVEPAFFDGSLVRDYDKTSYTFIDVDYVQLDDDFGVPIIGICGQFVKDTVLEREQILNEEGKIIKDHDSLRSSPSSMFVLILNNHRLLYVKETKDAPTKETFRATLLNFLIKKHKEFIQGEADANKEMRDRGAKITRVTKKKLNKAYPKPTLELIPLTSDEGIDEFIDKYDVLKTIEIILGPRNDENDNESFIKDVQKHKESVGSRSTTLKHTNKDGLHKDKSKEEVRAATKQGNQIVKLHGIDLDGDKLDGNNEHFEIRKPISNFPNDVKKAAKVMFSDFVGLVSDGAIALPNISDKAVAAVKSIYEKLL